MTEKSPVLSDAYALRTPDDSRRHYADWAETYDAGFAKAGHYELHLHTAQAFARSGGQGPVLDVGAGTGLCGVALSDLGVGPIDALDISPQMLEQATQKGVYRKAIEADLTAGLPVAPGSYAGIVSSGTFTTGHVGPGAIGELLKSAQPGAHFALSINARHYESAGFADTFKRLAKDSIDALTLCETPIYGPRATGEHARDIALIALFQKA